MQAGRSGAGAAVPTRPRLVESAGVAADLAVSDSAGRVDSQIAGAAVRAAVGSGGGGGSAPKAAHCDGPARDRRGRGSRMHSVPSCRASRGRNWRSTRLRDWFCSTVQRIERTGAVRGFHARSDVGSVLGSTGGSPLRTWESSSTEADASNDPFGGHRSRSFADSQPLLRNRVSGPTFGQVSIGRLLGRIGRPSKAPQKML